MYCADGRPLHVPPHPAALFVTNELGADIGTVIVAGLAVGLVASLVGGPLFLKFLGDRLPFKTVPEAFSDLEVREEKDLPLGATLFTLLPIALMLINKTAADLNMSKDSQLFTLLQFIGNNNRYVYCCFVAYYMLGIRRNMGSERITQQNQESFLAQSLIFY